MFSLGKRSFSLRDSPGKLSSLGSVSPLNRLQLLSPAKKHKTSETIQLMSSTLNEETLNYENLESRNQEHVSTKQVTIEPSLLEPNDKVTELTGQYVIVQASSATSIAANVETPPPTPDLRPELRLDVLRAVRSKLIDENNQLKDQLDQLTTKVTDCRKLFSGADELQLRYQNLSAILTKGQNSIRDQLNEIYNPGQTLAQSAKILVEEVRVRQERKLEKITLEYDGKMDQALHAIRQRKESLKHEIELHKRTLIHQSIQEQPVMEVEVTIADNKPSDQLSNNLEEESNDRECHKSSEDNECVIVDERGGSNDRADDDAMSAELSKSTDNIQAVCDDNDDEKTDVDDEKTDIEDASTGDQQSFTPCQAQRPEV